jgi:hypothetical protein
MIYKVQNENGKFTLVDLNSKIKIINENKEQLYTSFEFGWGFESGRADKEIELRLKRKSHKKQ